MFNNHYIDMQYKNLLIGRYIERFIKLFNSFKGYVLKLK